MKLHSAWMGIVAALAFGLGTAHAADIVVLQDPGGAYGAALRKVMYETVREGDRDQGGDRPGGARRGRVSRSRFRPAACSGT